ncbi:Uncharacterised protein [Mycobacteroides abscessus subsp. abscessus]|nr:Uncharacterised protein [Mycobacteroides abscessus subsp. abscessus]
MRSLLAVSATTLDHLKFRSSRGTAATRTFFCDDDQSRQVAMELCGW